MYEPSGAWKTPQYHGDVGELMRTFWKYAVPSSASDFPRWSIDPEILTPRILCIWYPRWERYRFPVGTICDRYSVHGRTSRSIPRPGLRTATRCGVVVASNAYRFPFLSTSR